MPDNGARFVRVRWNGEYAVLDRQEGKIASWRRDRIGRDNSLVMLRAGTIGAFRYTWTSQHPARGELRRGHV